MLKIVCVIPARLASVRFPKKVLSYIGGKSMLEHVWRGALLCKQFDSVHFAIDDIKTAKVIESFGGDYLMTAKDHPTGTHRVAEFQKISGVKADIWVIWQADEPFITPLVIEDLLQGRNQSHIGAWTLKKQISKEKAQDPNIVKVVTDLSGKALYFSRSLIPYDRDGEGIDYFKHIGLYAYQDNILKIYPTLEASPLSKIEKLEQLTLLENNIPIQVYQTNHEVFGVDTKQHLVEANQMYHAKQVYS